MLTELTVEARLSEELNVEAELSELTVEGKLPELTAETSYLS